MSIERIAVLGEGTYGKVYKIKMNDQDYAMKVIYIGHDDFCCIQEVDIIQHVDHPNIIRYIDFFIRYDKIYLVQELALSNLTKYIETNPSLDHRILFFYEVSSAINMLHSHNIYHCDIKTDNILVYENGHCKLADFGISFYGGGKPILCQSRYMLPPEILLGTNNTMDLGTINIWALGCILFFLLSGEQLIYHELQLEMEAYIKNPMSRLYLIDAKYKTELSMMLDPDVKTRIKSVDELFQFPWMKDKQYSKPIPGVYICQPIVGQNLDTNALNDLKILIDWLFEISVDSDLTTETVFHSIDLLYRMYPILGKEKSQKQLLGITCFLLVSVALNPIGLSHEYVMYATMYAYPETQIMDMKKLILETCNGFVTSCNLYTYSYSLKSLKQSLDILVDYEKYTTTDPKEYMLLLESQETVEERTNRKPKYASFSKIW